MARRNPRRRIDVLALEAERVLQEHRDAVLPNDPALDAAAQITPLDILSAEQLWDEAQRRGGTGLEGLLSAKPERRDD